MMQIIQEWNGTEHILDTLDVVPESTAEMVEIAKEWVGNDEDMVNIEVILRGVTSTGESIETKWQFVLPEYDWESIDWRHEERAR